MEPALDHLVLAVGDLDRARADYVALLGVPRRGTDGPPRSGRATCLSGWRTTYVELLAPDFPAGPLAEVVAAALHARAERPFALALGVSDVARAVNRACARGLAVSNPAPGEGRDDAIGVVRTWRSAFVDPATTRGVRLMLVEHTTPPDALPPAPLAGPADAACDAIDHVVVFTEDLSRRQSRGVDRPRWTARGLAARLSGASHVQRGAWPRRHGRRADPAHRP